MDIHVDELAQFVFVNNPPKYAFALSLAGLENTKELFFFLLDLFCKGLVLLFAKNGAKTIDMTSISQDDFDTVRSKLSCAGIYVHLDINTSDNNKVTHVNMAELINREANGPLESYVLTVAFGGAKYQLYFSLTKNK
jgi:hypothetical protein